MSTTKRPRRSGRPRDDGGDRLRRGARGRVEHATLGSTAGDDVGRTRRQARLWQARGYRLRDGRGAAQVTLTYGMGRSRTAGPRYAGLDARLPCVLTCRGDDDPPGGTAPPKFCTRRASPLVTRVGDRRGPGVPSARLVCFPVPPLRRQRSVRPRGADEGGAGRRGRRRPAEGGLGTGVPVYGALNTATAIVQSVSAGVVFGVMVPGDDTTRSIAISPSVVPTRSFHPLPAPV
jgi:hypothetical protein